MGMLTRFRSRLQSLPVLSKLNPTAQAEKTAQTVCLLSVVLLLPYFVQDINSLFLGSVGLVYTCLVLPMIISANYHYPLNGLKETAMILKENCGFIIQPMFSFLMKIYAPLDRLEQSFLQLHNIGAMINQMVFFALCDSVLVPGQRVTCLYTLMFYNVIAYCVSYIRELIEKEDWSPYVTITGHSNIKHLAMSATKIVLEWTKAVTFIITVVFMLLVFGLEQGLEHYKPTLIYTVVTWSYYFSTEKVFVDIFQSLITYLQLPYLENLEALWMPVLLTAYTSALSFVFIISVALFGLYRMAAIAFYMNVFLKLKGMYLKSLKDLNSERAVIGQFRYATSDELSSFDDVCAVCLNNMQIARITPCHHLFHGECLRQCLKTSDQCPLCKRELKFD